MTGEQPKASHVSAYGKTLSRVVAADLKMCLPFKSEVVGSKRVLAATSLAVLREQTAAQHKRFLHSFTGHSRQPQASFHQQNDHSIHPSVSTPLSLNATVASRVSRGDPRFAPSRATHASLRGVHGCLLPGYALLGTETTHVDIGLLFSSTFTCESTCASLITHITSTTSRLKDAHVPYDRS
jgi:hypothetical protein